MFSGIGGFTLAAQAVGYTTIGFSEIDPFACGVLKRHWPDVPNYGNIRNVRNVRAELVTGGFPCQPFSVAGKRRGAADDRHLWPQMLRVIRQARPAWVLAENVPGIITMELDNALADLETLGYACRPVVIPACAVDARHRRDRVWIIARRPVAHAHDTVRQAVGEMCEGLGSFHQWPAEPRVGRMDYGISHGTHRLRALGNAIVPQVAEEILRAIAKTDTNP